MRNGSRFGLVTVFMLSGLALTAAGCSSTEPPPGDAASQGGNGGHSGSGGAPGVDAGTTCQSLIQDYADAFQTSRACSPFLANVQCTHLASPLLQCATCQVHVNDTTRLDAIRAAFEARTDCPRVLCPAILCVDPGSSGACVANDSGSAGSCVDVR